LQNKKYIVLDNLNSKKDKRKVFIDLAKKNGFKVKCVYFDVPLNLAVHINNYRKKKGAKSVPMVVFHVFNKHFNMPSKSEGFDEIIVHEFTPNFDINKNKKMFFELS
jgi:bifunctional polynucleotide phosphatase/kinase